MAKLYELTSQLKCLERYIDDASEEESEQILQKLNEITIDVKSKGLNIAIIAKEMEANIDKFKKAECEIKRRRIATEKKLERLKNYLKQNMEACNITKICNEYIAIKLRHNPVHVKIFDERILPMKFLKENIMYSPNKVLIRAVMEKGEEVPGAILAKDTRLEIN